MHVVADFEADEGLDGPKADRARPLLCRVASDVELGTAYAMQVTRYSRIAVLRWLNGAGAMVRGGVLLLKPKPKMVYDGEWIVIPQGGAPYILPDDVFGRLYRTRKVKK